MAEALAPRTHPADTLGLAKGTRSSGQGRQGAAQPRAMFTPFLVLEEVKKALEAIVQWKVEHWEQEVELGGERLRASRYAPPRLLWLRAYRTTNTGGDDRDKLPYGVKGAAANHKGEALKAKGRPVRRAHLHDPTQAHLTDHHLNPRVAVVASLAPALPTWTSRLWFQRPLLADDAVGVSWPASVVGGVRGPERQAGTGALA